MSSAVEILLHVLFSYPLALLGAAVGAGLAAFAGASGAVISIAGVTGAAVAWGVGYLVHHIRSRVGTGPRDRR